MLFFYLCRSAGCEGADPPPEDGDGVEEWVDEEPTFARRRSRLQSFDVKEQIIGAIGGKFQIIVT